ncbi:hypothetical protein NEI07_02625 [Methylocystis sp. NLS-7]|nr:hypothetical protein [Methylocystis suflitae]
MQLQTQRNWCWAATSTSVSHFYIAASHWTQCLVANGELGHSDCCNSPVPSVCDVSWYLDRALQRTSNLDHMVAGTIAFDDIKAEIDAGRVVGVRVGWSGNGGGHFLAIYGYSEVGPRQFVDVDDPIYGKSHLSLSAFSTSYQGNGTWTHTYFTKRWPLLRFNLPDLTAFAIERILELRPLLAMKRGERQIGTKFEDDQSLSMPHYVYVAGLDDVLARGDGDGFPLSTRKSLRVFETEGERARAYFDLSIDDAPQVEDLSEDAATVGLIQQGASAAARIATESKEAPELRFVRIPALYVEAFWLHFEEATKDVYVPVRGIGLFTPMQPVSAEDFMATVRRAAEERRARPSDDAIAP